MTELDRAILRYRESGSDADRELVLLAQRAHLADFCNRQAAEMIAMQEMGR